jgi:nucleotide-binding universal stress UspA family protein
VTIDADLIVMGAHRKQLLRDIFVGTTIERVIRTGPFPVLMVNSDPSGPYRNPVAAVDISEHSVNAIKTAASTSLVGTDGLTLLHAVIAPGKRRMSMAGLSQMAIDEYVTSERRQATDELAALLAANDLGGPGQHLRVEEGEPMEVISRGVELMKHDLLIIGTRGRTGLLKALLGSVTEEALRRLDIDILAVPPAGPR